MIDRARQYIAQMPPAIAGSGGHAATFNVAVALIRGFALSEADAYPLLSEWNQTHTSEPWSESDLRHKLASAARSPKPLGYLLDPGEVRPPRTTPDFESEGDKRARLRASWPRIQPLTHAECEAIAGLRKLPFNSVDLCAKARFLGATQIDGHRCYTIMEGHFVQSRRLDGKPLMKRDGTALKAKNLPGSEGAFIGQRWIGAITPILLVEGAVGLLEATAAITIKDRTDWSPLAATSAASRFKRDPALLAKLRGRRVRIVPDADESGRDAAATWLAELEAVGALVDAVKLPSGFKDLGELIANPAMHEPFLTRLFS